MNLCRDAEVLLLNEPGVENVNSDFFRGRLYSGDLFICNGFAEVVVGDMPLLTLADQK